MIRIANESDLGSINEVYNASIPGKMATADLMPLSLDQRLEWFRKIDRKAYPVWIYEEEGHFAGWCALGPFYGRPAYNGVAEMSIYLAKNVQGKGLGNMIGKYVIQQAPPLGLEHLLAFVFDHNEASMRLFQKLGFSVWGLLPEIAKMEPERRNLCILGLKLNKIANQ